LRSVFDLLKKLDEIWPGPGGRSAAGLRVVKAAARATLQMGERIENIHPSLSRLELGA